MKHVLIAVALVLCASSFVFSQETSKRKSYTDLTAGLERIEGFYPLFYDAEKDRVLIEVSRLNEEFLYQVGLTTGVGSNPIGLDRGQPGSTKVVYFERAGNKLLLVQPNYDYRALSKNPAEIKAVEESFAKSVIWGFEIEASENGKYLVDGTAFFIRDAHNAAGNLEGTRQGVYSIDKSRSAFYRPNTKGFPKNTEIEATITLTAKGNTGRLINQTAPSGDSVTVRERHSFVELPDAGYKPRKFDPRVSANPVSFYDYATGINEELEKRWIMRHRLNKKVTNAPVSEAVEPIIYYVDNGAPPAIRDALIEGASWWNQAFEAAGYKDAFQVKVLPADADPMDIRYNVINWVHRSTRGWAYGSSVVDPRTGEIIRGIVTLDSQRARQDFLIGTGLSPQFGSGTDLCGLASMPDVDFLPMSSNDANALSIARIKQLSAHEVGHTLGFSHNFAASTYGRASVMDYPAPVIGITDGKLDYSNAYAVGIGAFDKFSVKFSYSEFQPGADEASELKKIVETGIANAMLYISDADARPAGAAHPMASLWDNGSDPVAQLSHEMKVRRIALDSFSLQNLADGTPLSDLELKLLPLFLYHRYQLTAAVKSVGGVYYTYSVRSGTKAIPERIAEVVQPAKQKEALAEVLKTLDARELMVPKRILELIPPQAFGMGSQRSERFESNSSPVLDPIGMSEIAANITVRGLLNPERAARLEAQHSRNSANPSFGDVIDALLEKTWGIDFLDNGQQDEVQIAIQAVVAEALMDLASDEGASGNVRRIASSKLRALANKNTGMTKGPLLLQRYEIIVEITRFLERPAAPRTRTRQLSDPPSDPIG